MTLRLVAVAVATALGAGACGGSSAEGPALVTSTTEVDEATPDEPTDVRAATIQQVPCPAQLTGDDVACGTAEVLLDPLRPEGPTTEISITTVRGYDAGFVTPLAVLQGGPGGASTDMVEWLAQQAFTQVFIDQRGTGFASSDFNCDEFDDAQGRILHARAAEAAQIGAEVLDECASRLASDPLFAYTTTANHAADVKSVMAGLGYDRWVAYGVSYGSTIAFELLRQPVASLAGVVLDGVYPPDIDVDAGVAYSAERALDELTSACAASAICMAYTDDVTGSLERSIARLDDTPVAVSLSGPESGVSGGVDVLVDGTRLAEFVFVLLYSERTVRFLPAIIAAIEDGDAAALEWLASTGSRTTVSSYAANDEATYFAVQCHDRYPFTGPISGDVGPFPAAVASTSLQAACPVWGQGEAYEIAGTSVVSSVPTLLLSGQFDPITPASYAEEAAAGLENATLITQAGRGHGIWIGDTCIASIVLAFVADPARSLDTDCAAEGVAVEWARP